MDSNDQDVILAVAFMISVFFIYFVWEDEE